MANNDDWQDGVPPAPEGVTPAVTPTPDVLADVHNPVGSSYDPMPLAVQETTSRNWMGVVALITGIIGVSLAAIVLGILGLNAVKQGKATNRSMNVWGIVLGVVWLIISIAATVAFVIFVTDAATKTAAVGDCYLSTAIDDDDLLDSTPVVIPCSGLTTGEVYYIGAFDGTAMPTDDTFFEEAYTFCTSDAALANVDTDLAAEYYVESYVPNASSWDVDPHTVVCAVATEGGPVHEDAILGD